MELNEDISIKYILEILNCLIGQDRKEIFSSWGNIIMILMGDIDLAVTEDFFNQNKEKLENSLDILNISNLNIIFSLINFRIRSFTNYNKNLDPKMFLWLQFLCDYLLERSKKDLFLKENFVPIIQQAFLSDSNNHHNEEKHKNIIINVVNKYFFRNNILPLRRIKKSLNEKKILDLFTEIDPKKRIINLQTVQEKMEYYLFSPFFISDIITFDIHKEEILERIEKEKADIDPKFIQTYDKTFNEHLNSSFEGNFFYIDLNQSEISLKTYSGCIWFDEGETRADLVSLNAEDIINILAGHHVYRLKAPKKIEKSAGLMKEIVDISIKKASEELKEVKISEISGPYSTQNNVTITSHAK